ncbi:MAG TPA: sterol desaturase family protein [Steroidobacteraceae bacterium]|nr:sterol desaturase family protein [Steroidobacteraceae bacterium]
MNYVEVAIPFFILAMLVEFLYGKLVKRQTYRLADTVNSLQLGTLSRLVDVLRLGFSAVVFGALVKWLGVQQWSMDAAWQWIAAFVAYDFCYYWKHRFGHEWRIMWASHIAHHQSEEFNLSTALRQTGTDYIGFVFYIPLYLAGVPAAAVVTVGSLNLIYQFWVHTEHIRRLGPLEWIFVTPSNHRVHHARNPEYIDRNYGGVFILWDRLFGTFQDERADVPCVYGITTGLKSWNPLWANLHFWSDTAKLAWRTRSWRDKLRIWFKPPAWQPADLDPHQKVDPNYPSPAKVAPFDGRVERASATFDQNEKFDPPANRYVRAYTFVQYWVLTFASLWLLQVEKTLPRAFVLLVFAWMCYSLFVQGVALEGRGYARRLEWLRVGITLVLAAVAYLAWPQALTTISLALAGYAAVSALAFVLGAQKHDNDRNAARAFG